MDIKPKLQLTGEDGNAFWIMGRATKAAKRAGMSQEKIDDIMKEAMEGDYNHLLSTMMKYFDVS
jgi:ERCC4-related helicase